MKCLICTKTETQGVYACRDCVNRLTRVLRELEAYIDFLPYAIHPIRGVTGRMSPGYGSKAPARVDVLAALDPGATSDEEADVRSLPGGVAGIALSIAEARGEASDGSYSYIRSSLWWCAEQDWVDELASDLFDLHRIARQLAGDQPQRPLGDCLNVTCDGKVRWGGPGKPARCSACLRTYDGLDLLRLGAAEETAA